MKSAQILIVLFSETHVMLTVKHLRLGTKPITLFNQAINFFTSLQHTLDGLM